MKLKYLSGTIIAAGLIATSNVALAEKINIAIGHQSMFTDTDTDTDTYTAGIFVKELGLLEKYLPTEGKYADAGYSVNWADYTLKNQRPVGWWVLQCWD